MKLDKADQLDSGCVFKNEAQSLSLTTFLGEDWDPQEDCCSEEAVTWVNTPTGSRRYLCEDHAAYLFRYGIEPDDVEDHPRGELCQSCMRPTLYDDLNHARKCPDCRE